MESGGAGIVGDTFDPRWILDQGMTTVLIGPEEKIYRVHKRLLCEKVGYFRSAYNANMQEAISNTFRFVDVADSTFQTLLAWLYSGKVFLEPGSLEEQRPLSLREDEVMADDAGDEDDVYENPASIHESASVVGYEYDSDYGIDEMEEDGRSENTGKDEVNAILEDDSEASLVRDVFSATSPGDLDAYQLDVLLRLAENKGVPLYLSEEAFSWYRERLTQVNDTTLVSDTADETSPEPDNFTRLIELYILADRLDVQHLRFDVLNFLQAEHDEQSSLLGGTPLPNLSDVAKIIDGVPSTSILRRWVVHVYAFRWQPQADTQEEVAARECVPKDFWMELACALAVRSSWARNTDRYPVYHDLCDCHNWCGCERDQNCDMRLGSEEKGRRERNKVGGIAESSRREEIFSL